MAKTKWVLLFTTFVLSCISLAIFIISFATTKWVVSEARSVYFNFYHNSEISYGLFSGTLIRQPLSQRLFLELTMTCLFDENVCAFSCQKDVDKRYNELRHLLKNETVENCPVTSSRIDSSDLLDVVHPFGFDRQTGGDNIYTEGFLSPGLWVATLIFLSIGMLFALISAIFSIINVTLNPIETILSVPGLFIWNGVTIVATLITCILYGSLFATSIASNIAISDTLVTNLSSYQSDGLASLGISYWILLVPIVLHSTNIGLLKYRNYVINNEAPAPTITIEKNDSTILLY